MSDYFDSVKRFASSTFNQVVQASNNVVAQAQQQQLPPIYVNGVMYQVLEKHGEVRVFSFFFFFFFPTSFFIREASRLFTKSATPVAVYLLSKESCWRTRRLARVLGEKFSF
jgi:hypothetical protein